MALDKKLRLNSEQRTNLVAYLDGELDPDAVHEIDVVLARSEVARHEVEQLSRTYELLDLLPRVKASDDFTERTLTTIRLEHVRRSWRDQPWFASVRRGVLLAGWLVLLCGAAVLGFLATNQWVPSETDRLLQDLPVIERYEIYSEIENLDFLRELRDRKLLPESDESSSP